MSDSSPPNPPNPSPPSSEGGVTLQGRDIKIGGDVVGRDLSKTFNNIINIFTGKRDSLEHRNRRVMLEKVRNFWVKGVLEQSLHGAALIELGMEYRPEAVQYPWTTVLQRPDQPAQPLPLGTKTSQVFDEVSGELLILGAPGSGKTTMLLDLARDLIARAEQDETLPIPVVFNLASWAEKRLPLAEWLVDELRFRYDVPKKIAVIWVKDDYALPLLDGLDEVKLEHRAACVESINHFRKEHGLLPTVVCSRIADYEALNAQLRLRGAIVLQPLTREQVDGYLVSAGEQLTSVRILLQRDAALQELAESPLMLSIMALAYRGMSVESLPELTTIEAQRKHLFDNYVQRMFERRGSDKRYTQQQVTHWLAWLAGRMVERAQTVFFLERMQPSLLQNQSQKWLYKMATWLFAGMLFGLEEEIKTVETLRWSWLGAISGLVLGLVLGPVGGLIGGLLYGLGDGLVGNNLIGVLFLGLFAGLFVGLGLTLVGGLVGLPRGLQVGKEIETKTAPNQGIWRSAQNAILGGLLYGLIGWLVVGGGIGLGVGLVVREGVGLVVGGGIGLGVGLVFGLVVGLLSGLVHGLAACIQHSVLRFLLYRSGSIPLNYVRFLDYCAERIFLRKVGGGYIFVHRLLMEYFAGLETEGGQRIAARSE